MGVRLGSRPGVVDPGRPPLMTTVLGISPNERSGDDGEVPLLR